MIQTFLFLFTFIFVTELLFLLEKLLNKRKKKIFACVGANEDAMQANTPFSAS